MLRHAAACIALSLSSALALLACSSDPPGGGGGCKAYTPPTGDLQTPTASFKDHVFPIFKQSCGLSSSCHGSTGSSKGNLYLGNSGETNAAQVRAGLLGKTGEDIDMKLVTPGDPANSYLMHKMDGDQCTLKCKSGDCKRTMPDGSDPLAEEKRLTVRRWIVQGAKDN